MILNRYIAESGKYSRREAERLIREGAVTVNGKPAELGMHAGEGDDVRVGGVPITRDTGSVVLLVYKPVGITSTTDRSDKSNIIDFVNYPKRLFTVGRLDKDSEGAILLTNNGDYVNALLRSENGHEKVYRVRVDKPVTEEFLRKMSDGVEIYNPVRNEYVTTKRCETRALGANSFEVTLTQGFNRQIRRMCSALGFAVTRLERIRFLFLNLEGLKPGQWRRLTEDEVKRLDEIIHNS